MPLGTSVLSGDHSHLVTFAYLHSFPLGASADYFG